ncbi:XRE family transcriptional regulator [Variovorax sp. DAIF25]|uniref:XRE family transcriptional regulator n=1 Tax=Variovorax sp. DAIF25 TaxID=3080983 RepID=UPI003D6AF6DA
MKSTNVEIGERLKLERQRLGLAQADFGTKAGVSKTSQFNYEAGERSPDAEYLHNAAELGVDITYVITGRRVASNDDFVVIPQHAVAASAGPGAVNADELSNGGLSFSKKWLAKRMLNPTHLKVIDVVGESMLPRLSDGDKVLVDVSDTTPKSGRAYVLLQGEELLVKYCQLLPEGMLRVSSANTDYPTYDIDLSKTDGVSIVGRVRASTHEW